MNIEQLRNNLKQALIEDYTRLSKTRVEIIDENLDEFEKSQGDVSIGMNIEDAAGMVYDLANITDEDGHSAISVSQVLRVLTEIYDSLESKNAKGENLFGTKGTGDTLID